MNYWSLAISPSRSSRLGKGLETGAKTSGPARIKMWSLLRDVKPLNCGTCLCLWLWTKTSPLLRGLIWLYCILSVHGSWGLDWGCGCVDWDSALGRFYMWTKSHVEPNMRLVVMYGIDTYVYLCEVNVCVCTYMHTHIYLAFFYRFAKWFTMHILKTEEPIRKVQLPKYSRGEISS